jgi:hypothetical protein
MKSPANFAVSLLCFFCVTILPAVQLMPRAAPDISKPVLEIIEKFMRAGGGAELQKIFAEKRTGTLVRGSSGAVPFETVATDSGKWRYHQVFAYGDQVTYGCDGDQSWVQDTQGISSLPPAERLELALLLDPQMPRKLGQIFPDMSVKGDERIGEKDAVVIAATTADGVCLELAFDRASGLLLRAGDLFFEDYRDIGKVKRPYTVWLGADAGRDSLRLKMQFAEIRQNADLDEAIFANPGCALPAAAPVLYSLRVEVPVSREARQACVGVYQAIDDPLVLYTVTRQEDHLMIERTGWGTSFEILPESETDYFMRFLNREFHFIKDAAGQVLALELGADRGKKAKKIK